MFFSFFIFLAKMALEDMSLWMWSFSLVCFYVLKVSISNFNSFFMFLVQISLLEMSLKMWSCSLVCFSIFCRSYLEFVLSSALLSINFSFSWSKCRSSTCHLQCGPVPWSVFLAWQFDLPTHRACKKVLPVPLATRSLVFPDPASGLSSGWSENENEISNFKFDI